MYPPPPSSNQIDTIYFNAVYIAKQEKFKARIFMCSHN